VAAEESPATTRPPSASTPRASSLIELPLMPPSQLLGKLAVSEFPQTLQPEVASIIKQSESGALSPEQISQALGTLSQIENAALKGPAPQRYYFLKGLLQLALEDAPSALQSLTQAQRLRASDPDTVFLKGLAQLRLKKSLEGLDAIKESQWFGKARFFPESEVLYAQAVGYSQLGNTPKAAESLNAAINAPAATAYTRIALSKLELARGNIPAALKAAREAAALEGGTDQGREANMQLVRVLLTNPDPLLDGARISEADRLSAALYDKAPAASGEARVILPLRVKSLLATRKPEIAEKMVLAALKKAPGDAELEQLLKQVTIEKSAAVRRE
jgi:hypothetical protein